MTIEGGVAGWELGLDLVAPWIALAGIKSFRWVAGERYRHGQQRYRWEYTPLADGQAPLPEFMAYLKQLKYDGIVSLHSEYKGASSFRRLSTAELLRQSAEDLAYLKTILRKEEG
jgi:sugar phosphate isomerase/epimerase